MIVATAPKGTAYANLFAGASKLYQTSGAYYDDFQLTFEKEVEQEQPEILEVIVVAGITV